MYPVCQNPTIPPLPQTLIRLTVCNTGAVRGPFAIPA